MVSFTAILFVLSLLAVAQPTRAQAAEEVVPLCEVRHPDLRFLSMIDNPRFRAPSWSRGVVHESVSDDSSVFVLAEDPEDFPLAESTIIATNPTHPKIALTFSTHPTKGVSKVTRYFHLRKDGSCRAASVKGHRYLINVSFYHSHYLHPEAHKNVWDD
jgi:hypothetical protein